MDRPLVSIAGRLGGRQETQAYGRSSSQQVRGPARVIEAGVTTMIDRQWIGDLGLAILLALPTAALSRPQPAIPEKVAAATPLIEQAALADQSPTERRFSLDG